MKIFALILILVTIGCKNDQSIAEFESKFGIERANELSEALLKFEKVYLQEAYPDIDLEEAYKQFVFDFYTSSNVSLKPIFENFNDTFNSSAVFEQIFGTVDSVWTSDSNRGFYSYGYRVVYVTDNDSIFQRTFDTGIGSAISTDKAKADSIMFSRTYKLNHVNHHGAFHLALNQVRKQDSFLDDYVDRRNSAHTMSKIILARFFLKENANFSDYFVRRLIFTDIVL